MCFYKKEKEKNFCGVDLSCRKADFPTVPRAAVWSRAVCVMITKKNFFYICPKIEHKSFLHLRDEQKKKKNLYILIASLGVTCNVKLTCQSSSALNRPTN